MNEMRFKSLMAGQTAIARKVFDAVPAMTPWTSVEIHRELIRSGCSVSSLNVVEGCLSALVDAGLIRGNYKDGFIRTKVTSSEPKTKEPAPVTKEPAPVTTAPTKDNGPIELLASLSAKLRGIAEEIDSAALQIASQIEANNNRVRALDQLRAVLKEL